MNTKSTKLKIAAWALALASIFLVYIVLISAVSNFASAASSSSKKGLSEAELNKFAQNNILFYDPGDCIPSGGGSGTLCGDTARDMYWSALSKYTDDPIKLAGIMGNLANEGGYQPVKWEYAYTNNDGTLAASWDTLYNCDGYGCPFGVGSFGFTWSLGKYLHYVHDTAPDLLKYYQDSTKYSLGAQYNFGVWPESGFSWGDVLMEKIGREDFTRLVETEVGYAMGDWNPTTTNAYLEKSFSSPSEAAIWWMDEWERPKYRNPSDRARDAEKAYDDFKDFTCTSSKSSSSSSASGSTGTSSVSGSDITWIGDSDSALAHDEKGYELVQRTFPGVDYGSSFNEDGSYIQSGKFISQNVGGNKSGLDILKEIIQENKLRPYLVFALGGNGGWTDTEMEEFLKLIDGKDVKVIITTARYKTVDYPTGNEIARKTAEEHPNIYLADIAANYKDEYIDDTGIEFNAEGGKMFIQTIKDTINSASVGNNCGAKINPIVTVDGNKYMFPLAGASKDNYLHGINEESVLSPMPCSNYSVGACHHDYVALDMGLRKQKVDGQEKTDADYSDINYDDYYYYSDGIKVLAFVEGEVTYAGHYSNGVPNGYGDKCGQLMYRGVDGNEYWLGHLAYNESIKVGDTFKLGDIIGEVGPPPCAQGTQSHVHIHISPDTSNDTKLYDIINATYEALPETRSTSSSSDCGDNNDTSYCNDKIRDNSVNFDTSGLNEHQAQKLADFYNSTDGTYNCTTFVMWFIQNFTDLEYGGGDGGDVAHNLAVANNLEEGNEPRQLSVFSVTSIGSEMCGNSKCGHTGIIASVDGDTLSTVEAAWQSYGGTVFTNLDKSSFSNSKYGKTYVYLDGHIDMDKLKKVIGS